MKFSSEDIAQQRFETKFRGYDSEQVREFLEVVAGELDSLKAENRRLNRENEELATELADYRKRERSLHDALEMARDTAADVRAKAEREAEIMIAEAEVEAERKLSGAERQVETAADDIARLKEQRRRITAEIRATLEMHLHLLDSQRSPQYLSEPADDEVAPPPAPTEPAIVVD